MTERRAQPAGRRRFGNFEGPSRVLSQTIRYSYSAPVTNLRQRLMVVPRLSHGPQRRRRWSLTVAGVPASSVVAGRDLFGNLSIDVRVPRVDTWVEFNVQAEVAIRTAGAAGAAPAAGAGRPIRPDDRYARPTRLTAPAPALARLARRVDPGDVAGICALVHESIGYKWGITGVRTTAAEALAGGRGVCQDFAHIMLAACRWAGLPARYVSGHLVGEGGSHAWVEVLPTHPDRSGAWIAEGWDPTHNRRTDEDYVTVAVGRDYADVAPMWGTFRGVGVTGTLAVSKRLSLA